MAHLWIAWEAFKRHLPPKELYLGASYKKKMYLASLKLMKIKWKWCHNILCFPSCLPFYGILILNWCENWSQIFKNKKRIYFSLVYAWSICKKKLFIPVVKQRKSCVISCLKSFNIGKPLIHFMLFSVFLEFGLIFYNSRK